MICARRFRFGVKRKPQASAADAVNLWILNPTLLIMNELELFKAMPSWRTYSSHTASVWQNGASMLPAVSLLPIRLESDFWTSNGLQQRLAEDRDG